MNLVSFRNFLKSLGLVYFPTGLNVSISEKTLVQQPFHRFLIWLIFLIQTDLY